MPFTGFGLDATLLRAIRELGFTRPTPIQAQAIPPAMQGKDVLACAMTGSGKTAAFLLPILQHLRVKPRGVTRALVLAPTRELAAQIHEHLEELAVHTPVTGAAVFGGVGMEPQEHAFRSGVDVVIATPGRLLDHFSRPYAKLERLEYLVIDEADRMLDMGFLPDIRKVLRHIPTKRQTLFFSATLPPEIVRLAGELLRHPVTLNLERKAAPAIGITQAVYPVPRELKSALVVELVRQGVVHDAILFTRTKHRANRLSEYLTRHGLSNAKIHGNRSQNQRTEALAGFKSGKFKLLVATDIVARGIDVEALGHVVNFDVPNSPDDYIHRVGRTARAETTGDAFTFVAPDEEAELAAIERAVGRRLPRVTLPGFDYARKPTETLEVPLAERLAAHRAQRAVARGRAQTKTPHRGAAGRSAPSGPAKPAAPARPPAAKPKPSSGLHRFHRRGK
jgi:ATP-dependent RNA helicase RhlE